MMMEPSAQGLAVLLGILKAGGTYVPLDPGWPEPRKRAVLERAGVRRLWVDAAMMETHYDYAPVVEVPEQPEHVPGDLGPGPRAVSGAQLAYIIFTSGSTGEPKGVMVEHRSVVNHNLAIAARFGLRAGDRMLQFAPLSFDAAAEDLYPPLAVGGTVVMRSGLVPAHTMTPYLEQEGITIISLPPTYIEEWVRQMEALGQRVPARLRLLAPGGDVLKRETFEAWCRVGGGHAPWVNVYGPTECTITSATCDIPGAEGVGTDPTFPIGRPIPRVRFYLLDDRFEPVLPGLPGKVYIGGAALSRGYLGAPHQTAERFLPDPFSSEPGARMYHTGDLARLQPDGRLRFLGRVGPPGEDPRLPHRAVGDRGLPAALPGGAGGGGARPHRSHRPAAALRLRPGPGRGEGGRAARRTWRRCCPRTWCPRRSSSWSSCPSTTTARWTATRCRIRTRWPPRRRPSPSSPRRSWRRPSARRWRCGCSGCSARCCASPTSRHGDNFFELGGDSLLAMRLLGRMEEEFGLPVPLATLFQYPVLKDAADALQGLLESEPGQSNLVRLSGPDTPADAPAVFLFHPGDGELHHYRYLAPLLEPRLRSFGLQAPEAMSGRTFADFDERIAAYVKDIQAVQPHGPYRLIGYSYGGYLALGVAAALEAAGEKVELLAMLDTLTFDTIDAVVPTRVDPALLVAEEFTVLDEELERELAPLSPEAKWDLRGGARSRQGHGGQPLRGEGSRPPVAHPRRGAGAAGARLEGALRPGAAAALPRRGQRHPGRDTRVGQAPAARAD